MTQTEMQLRIATNLLRARSSKKLTSEQLAKASGLSRATISQLESALLAPHKGRECTADPRLSTLVALASVLEIQPEDLLKKVP